MSSLWGNLSSLKTVRTPKAILAEQANILNDTTKGVIRAGVSSSQSGGNLTHTLQIVAPILANYSYSVCVVQHDINIYPCTLYESESGRWVNCANEEELIKNLAGILGSDKTRRVIEALLSQSRV